MCCELYECFTPKISLLGRTQSQKFDCLYRAKRYGQPCTEETRQLLSVQFFLFPLEHIFFANIFFFQLKKNSHVSAPRRRTTIKLLLRPWSVAARGQKCISLWKQEKRQMRSLRLYTTFSKDKKRRK